MRLYLVRIESYAVVAAGDEFDADREARDSAREIIANDFALDVDVMDEINSVEQLSHGWDGDCMPYGETRKTIAEILKP